MCRNLLREAEGRNMYILFCVDVPVEGKDMFSKIAEVSMSWKTNFDLFGCFLDFCLRGKASCCNVPDRNI